MKLLQDLVGKVALFSSSATFPSGTFEEETVNIRTTLCYPWQIVNILIIGYVCP